MLAIDYQALQTTQKQACLALLDQLYHVSAALREVQDQRCLLFQQQQALYEQQYILNPTLSQQHHVLSQRLSPLLKEYTTLLGQLACLRAYNR